MKTNLLVDGAFSLTLVLVALAAQPASAELININFGTPTNSPYTGNIETSPATPGGTAGTWNNLTNSVANGPDSYETDGQTVLFSDGSTGPTLAFDTSRGNDTWNTGALTVSTVNYTTPGGVYDVADLYETGVINTGNNTTGLRIKGLTPGNYEVYLVPMFRKPDPTGVTAFTNVLTIGLGNDTDARNAGGYTLTSTAASPTQNIDTRFTNWVAAIDGSTNSYNCIGASVTIDSTNRWLTFLLQDASSEPDRAGPSVIQLRKVTAPSASVPRITSIIRSGSNVIISGTNGTHNGTYHALRSASVQSPIGTWTSILTNNFDSNGNFSFTNTPSGSPSFYIIEQQP